MLLHARYNLTIYTRGFSKRNHLISKNVFELAKQLDVALAYQSSMIPPFKDVMVGSSNTEVAENPLFATDDTVLFP